MGRYIDFNVKLTEIEDVINIRRLTYLLGYSEIVIETSLNLSEFIKTDNNLPHISRRITLRDTNIDILRKRLGRERYNFEIISLLCQENKTAKWAAQDNRIDTFVFPTNKSLRLFDSSMARLAATFRKAIEIPLLPLIKHSFRERISLVRGYFRAIKIAQKANCPVILSSGATSLLEIRSPRDMACFAEIIGLTESEALDSLSTIPKQFLSQNKKKLGTNFVVPGIWLNKEEEE